MIVRKVIGDTLRVYDSKFDPNENYEFINEPFYIKKHKWFKSVRVPNPIFENIQSRYPDEFYFIKFTTITLNTDPRKHISQYYGPFDVSDKDILTNLGRRVIELYPDAEIQEVPNGLDILSFKTKNSILTLKLHYATKSRYELIVLIEKSKKSLLDTK